MDQKYNKGLLFWRKFKDQLFKSLFILAIVITLSGLVALLWGIFSDGFSSLNWKFLTSWPSRFAANAGIKSSLVGTLAFIGITAPLGMIIGVSTAIYLEEYVKKNRFSELMQLNISNLAGVPSIVYGMLGLVLFVRGAGLGRSVLSGALTMTLLILPVIITASQEAIKAVPVSLRHASYALGATVTQTTFRVVLPIALPPKPIIM
jgi:phosphate transport system permease protein